MIPAREVATKNGQTYFVTSSTAGRRPFFRHDRWANLMVDVLVSYRPERYLLHGFTVMPDHFHALITPAESLEKAVQMMKGGFSFKAKRELGWTGDVWVTGFSDHRVRDHEDYVVHEKYIARNAVKAGIVADAREYKYASASGLYELDAFPRGLKPGVVVGVDGGAEAPPLQSKSREGGGDALPLQSTSGQAHSLESKIGGGGGEASSLQSMRGEGDGGVLSVRSKSRDSGGEAPSLET